MSSGTPPQQRWQCRRCETPMIHPPTTLASEHYQRLEPRGERDSAAAGHRVAVRNPSGLALRRLRGRQVCEGAAHPVRVPSSAIGCGVAGVARALQSAGLAAHRTTCLIQHSATSRQSTHVTARDHAPRNRTTTSASCCRGGHIPQDCHTQMTAASQGL